MPPTNSAEYKYDPDGNRVEKIIDGTSTKYLIDSQNLTGYSQVFIETTGANKTAYIIGDDILAQATGTGQTDIQYLLYDGHGSTRQLADSTGNLISNESYSYDSYGVLLGGNPTSAPTTSLLYSGEQFDVDAQMYYLRARYYDPLNGRFNQTDPFAGSPQDPQSLHKYLYAHNNPVNGIDPSGNFALIIAGLVLSIIRLFIAVRLKISGYIPSPYANITKPIKEVCGKYDKEKCKEAGVEDYDKGECHHEAYILARRYYVKFTQWAKDNPGYQECTTIAQAIMKMNLDAGLKWFSLRHMVNYDPPHPSWWDRVFGGGRFVGVFHLCNKERTKNPATADQTFDPHNYFYIYKPLPPIADGPRLGWHVP